MSDRYERASRAYEDAAMAGDQERRKAALAELEAAGEEHAEQMARRLAAPDFETVLADPTIQPDREGRILASIEEYQNAKPASAGVPVTHRCDQSCGSMSKHEANEWISAAYDRGYANGVVGGIEIGKCEAGTAVEARTQRWATDPHSRHIIESILNIIRGT